MVYSTYLLMALAATGALSTPVAPRTKTLTVPLQHANNVKSIKGLVEKGQARIQKVNGAVHLNNAVSSGTVINEDVSYVAPFKIGGTTYNLIVDTGCK
jgi:hypothetical protein